MSKSLRRARKNFRQEVRRLIESGGGNTENLMALAAQTFNHGVDFASVLTAFYRAEVGHAVTFLRNEGVAETIGKKWKPVAALEAEDVATISVRRLKRLRGALKAQVRLAHEHGRVEEAVSAGKMLAIVDQHLNGGESIGQPAEESQAV